MAGDPFRVLTPGDAIGAGDGPFDAQWHNLATEAIRVSQRATPPGMTPRDVIKERDTDIWVANVSEADIDEFRPVGLGDLAIDPAADGDFRERLCFLTDKLASGRPFGIVQEPIGAGKLYACKLAAGPGGQPPNQKWLGLVGEAEPWNGDETYAVGEQVAFSAETYVALRKHRGSAPGTNPSCWRLIGPHRGIWTRGDTYAPGDVVVEPQLGRVVVDGVSRARISVQQTTHQYAALADGELQSAEAGPIEILWRQGGLGEQWAVVRLCGGAGLVLPECNGNGEALLPAMMCDGVGSYIYRPGGALVMGAMTCAGSGVHSYPARSGSGTPALGAMRSGGYGKVYDSSPSGRLHTAPMTLAGSGTRTQPPVGSGMLKAGVMNGVGFGTRSLPAHSGTGALSLNALTGSASRGSYAGTSMFVAKMTNPLFQAPTGRWVYDWAEQTINPSDGDYQDLAGGKSGHASSGPFMRERNNNLVKTPVFGLARLRGPWNGQPLYDFEHCCTDGAETASGSLVLGAMTCDGDGWFIVPPPKVGAGNLLLGAMTGAGTGYASACSVNVGAGTPQLGAPICTGAGLSSAHSVNLGIGQPQFGPMICVGTGLSMPPHFDGAGNPPFGVTSGAGTGLSSTFSVNIGKATLPRDAMTCAASGLVAAPVLVGVGNLQQGPMSWSGIGLSSTSSVSVGVATLHLVAMVGSGSGEAWVSTQESTEGGVVAGGSHQALFDLGTHGGVAAGGSHESLTDLGIQGGVAAGGCHETLSDLGRQGGVAAGGSHQGLADLGTDGGVAAGGSYQGLADLGTDGGVAAGRSHQ